MTNILTNPLKWHGGKTDLASWIIGLMPPRCQKPNNPSPDDPGWLHYVEPFAGGLAVMLAMDPEGVSEVANDLNVELSNFWGVLQNKPLFDAFCRVMQVTPFSKAEYDAAGEVLAGQTPDIAYDYALGMVDDPLAAAVAKACGFFVRCRQSLSGRMNGFAGITRNRTRRGMNEQVSAWLNCVEGLPAVHERLKRVLILDDKALNVIRKEDGPRTLFYLDPPYLHETRATTGEYEHEMLYEDHFELLNTLQHIKGRFLLSGYDSPVYEQAREACGWTRHEKAIHNHAAGGKTKRVMTECIWTNF